LSYVGADITLFLSDLEKRVCVLMEPIIGCVHVDSSRARRRSQVAELQQEIHQSFKEAPFLSAADSQNIPGLLLIVIRRLVNILRYTLERTSKDVPSSECIMFKIRWLLLSLVALIAQVALARAGDLDPKDILAKAIKALGGADKLGQAKVETWKETGTFYGFGMKLPYVANWTFQAPDKYHFLMDIEFMGQKNKLVFVINGDKAWEKFGEMQRDVEGEKLADVRHQCYSLWVLSLLPLQDKSFTLTSLGDTKLDGKDVVGFKVARKDHKDVSVFFDPKTGLPAGYATKSLDEETMKEVNQEAMISDYVEVGGRKYFTKLVIKREGKLTIEATLADQKSLDKVDSKFFDKP
jgi:hypothetical protein